MDPSSIREYGVFAGQKHAFLKDGTRFEYMEHFMDRWFGARRYRGYSIMAGLAGAYFLFSLPLLSAPLLAAAAYFYTQHKMNEWYTEGDYAGHRNLILAD